MHRGAPGGGPLARVPAPALVIGGVVGLQSGAAVATTLIPLAGVPGTVALRLGFGALGLITLARPRVRALPGRAAVLAVLVGAVLAVHHVCFYAAIHRLPLGVAVTLEFFGPLGVALVGSQRRTDLVWAGLAAAGVAATAGLTTTTRINAVGVILALAAGACWAAYIVIFPRLARTISRRDGLALATLAAAAFAVPDGIIADGHRLLNGHTLLIGAIVAALSDVIAYSLQSEALGRMTGRMFSVLSSTEPGVGAILGATALDQSIAASQWAGMLAVTAASIGATRTHQAEPSHPRRDPPPDD